MHKEVFTGSSEYFNRAMNGDWAEATDKTLYMPDDRPLAFQIYAHWLYRRTIATQCAPTKIQTEVGEWGKLIQAYVLGEKIMDGPFKDALVDAMAKRASVVPPGDKRWFPHVDWLKLLYAGTPSGSQARELIVEAYVNFSYTKGLDDEYPKDFLLDIANSFLRKGDKGADRAKFIADTETCKYHQHEPGVEHCYRSATSE